MNTTEMRPSFEQRVLRKARDRGITDGPSPLQHFDVLLYHVKKARLEAKQCINHTSSGQHIFAARAFGQCLFDLIVQASFQGVTLEDCLPDRNLHACIPPVWPLVDTYLCGLRVAIDTLPIGDPLTKQAIAQVHSCVQAGTYAYLSMTPEWCLELTLEHEL